MAVAGEMTWWRAQSVAQRSHSRETEAVRTQADLAAARILGIAEAGQTAMLGTLGLAMMKREAELMVPDAAPYFNTVVMCAAQGMTQQITRLAGQW